MGVCSALRSRQRRPPRRGLKGAGEISQEAVDQVRKAATGVISGVKVVVKEPFK